MRAGIIVLSLLIGGFIGLTIGYLVGLGALTIPGLGPIAGAGSTAVSFKAGLIGLACGGLLSGLLSLLIVLSLTVRQHN